MLTVTSSAKEKLKATLLTLSVNPDMAFRITTSRSSKNHFKLILDRERKGDHVVKNKEGTKLLLIGTDIAPKIDGIVISYYQGKTPRESNFIISKPVSCQPVTTNKDESERLVA